MDEEVSIEEITKALKDADMYEQYLSQNELRAYYKALKNSENTASQEEESRNFNDSIEKETLEFVEDTIQNVTPMKKEKKSFTPKSWSAAKRTPSSRAAENSKSLDDKDELDDDKKPKDATKITFGFNEMSETIQFKFDIIKHDLKYIPIQCTPEFLTADITTKAKILYSYHTKMQLLQDYLARQSFQRAPLPKPIVSHENSTLSDLFESSETYISRSGRQTKRKLYCDETSLDNDFVSANNKKTKSIEDEWSYKNSTKRTSPRVKTIEKVIDNDEQLEETENIDSVGANTTNNNYKEDNIKASEKIVTDVASSGSKSKLSYSNSSSKKLTNPEIMQRSKLFKDSTKRTPRCEILFNKLIEETEKKQKEEKAMREFEITLEQIDIDEEIEKINKTENESEELIEVVDEEPIRRRVVPRIPGRKPINKKKSNSSVVDLIPLSVVLESPPKRKDTPSSSQDTNSTPSAGKKRTKPNKKACEAVVDQNSQRCPICNGLFQNEKIEEHAATCGDEKEIPTPIPSKMPKISCEICDKVFLITTAYEAHVRDCIRSKQI